MNELAAAGEERIPYPQRSFALLLCAFEHFQCPFERVQDDYGGVVWQPAHAMQISSVKWKRSRLEQAKKNNKNREENEKKE